MRPNTYPADRPGTPALRLLAHIVSVVFHPLFISSYVMAFLIYVHPAVYEGFDSHTKLFRFLNVVLFNAFFPGFTIFIAWRLKLVKSMIMSTARDRIIPYALTMFFYWWTLYVARNLPDTPHLAVKFLTGSFLAVCVGWFCNIFFKISMHTLAVGGLFMYFVLFQLRDPYGSGLYLSAAVLIAGLVTTSRLMVSDHSQFEIYSGFFAGMASMWIGWLVS